MRLCKVCQAWHRKRRITDWGNLTIKRYLSIIKEVPLEMNDTTKVEDRRVR